MNHLFCLVGFWLDQFLGAVLPINGGEEARKGAEEGGREDVGSSECQDFSSSPP